MFGGRIYEVVSEDVDTGGESWF